MPDISVYKFKSVSVSTDTSETLNSFLQAQIYNNFNRLTKEKKLKFKTVSEYP